MPRWLMMLIFAAVSLALHALIARYLWARLVRDTRLVGWGRRLATGIIVVGAVAMPLTMWATRMLEPSLARAIGWPVFLWLTISGLVMFLLGASDLLRLVARVVATLTARLRRRAQAASSEPASGPDEVGASASVEPPHVDQARRTFMARAIGGAAVTVVGGATAYGVTEVVGTLPIVDVPVSLTRWPTALDGYRIVQLTDVHIGYTVTRRYVAEMVARANHAEGDLIVITGDLVDGDVATLADAVAPLAELRAPDGVFFVTGNHEYYAGANEWISHLRSLGVRVLRNERVTLGRGEARFELVGIDDHSAGRYLPDHGPDLKGALLGVDPARETILLAHQPRQLLDAARHGIGLQLSGHTHGGQVWPWHYLAAWQQGGYLAGRYRKGRTQLYVSRGSGYWGPPVRIGAPAEIARVIVRRG